MKPVFVDTAGWMACGDSADPGHEGACRARYAALEAGRTLVRTDYVVDHHFRQAGFRLWVAPPLPKRRSPTRDM